MLDMLISSLVQIIVDPYFRTINGMMVLIDKEWVQKGFPFHREVHQLDSELSSSSGREREPRQSLFYNSVYFLFLSCIFDLIHCHPLEFQFTERLLTYLMEAIYSPDYTTFDFRKRYISLLFTPYHC